MLYTHWLQVISLDALNGEATAREGLDALAAIRAARQHRRKDQARTPTAHNMALDVIAKAALHSQGSVADGLEVLQALKADQLGLSPVSLSSFIQIAKADRGRSYRDASEGQAGAGEGPKDPVEVAWAVYTAAPVSIRTQRVVTMMISCLSRRGHRKRARSVLEEAIDAGLTPNRYMFNAAMGACSKPEQVFELFSRMQIAGIEGDAVTQKYLRLARKGKLPSSGVIAANKIRHRKLRPARRQSDPPSATPQSPPPGNAASDATATH